MSATYSRGAIRSQLTFHYFFANGAVCWACSLLHKHHTVYCLDTPQTNTLTQPPTHTHATICMEKATVLTHSATHKDEPQKYTETNNTHENVFR